MKSGKTIETAQRALEILKNLMHQNLSVDKILDKLCSTQDLSVVYTKEAIYKYFNTFKLAGINIEKQNGAYCVKNLLNSKQFTKENILTLNFLENYIRSTQQSALINKFNNIRTTIEKNNIDVNSNIVSLDYGNIFKLNKKYEKYKQLINDLEEYCKNKQIINLSYIENDNLFEHKVVANKIIFEKGKLLLHAFCKNSYSNKNFIIENIQNIKQLPQRSDSQFLHKTILFKLMGNLAINYKLKRGEYVQEKGDGYLIVANNYQNQDELMKRLLRYGENCEIKYPVALRDVMKDKIKKTLDIYKN